MKIKHPSAIVSLIIVAFAFALSIGAFAISTIMAQHNHDEQLETAQRQINGNQAMLFAICRGFRRRDLFEEERLKTAEAIEFHYQQMTKPFSPTVRAYFHARRAAVLKNAQIQKKQFVDFNCIKGMERAYLDGYRNYSAPTGRPAASPFRSP